MLKTEFKAMLNEIRNTEYSFRNIQSSVDANGHTIKHGPDILKTEYDYVLCFLVYLRYKNIISFEQLATKDDLSNAINLISGNKKTLINEIWNELKEKYPYYDKLLPLIARYNLTKFDDAEYEKELAVWGNSNCLSHNDYVLPIANEIVCINLIRNCQKQLGIDMENGEILIQTNISPILFEYLSNNPRKAKLYLYDCEPILTLVKISQLLDYYSNIKIISDISDIDFDGIISLNLCSSSCNTWDSWNQYLKEGGFCIAGGQEMKSLPDYFYDYHVPLMLEMDKTCILYKKSKDTDTIVRYGQFYSDGVFDDEIYWTDKLSECIKNRLLTPFYEEVKKEDFKYTCEIQFNKVRRKNDQRNFVWVKKSDVVLPANEECKWLWDTKLSDESIIDWKMLSKDPFKINADPKIYLNSNIIKHQSNEHVLNECKIERDRDYYCNFEIPNKYIGVFKTCYYPERTMDEKAKEFDKALCCRVLTHPTLLYNRTGILRVKANEDRPVCFRKYSFYYDLDFFGYSCNLEIEPISINPDFDENFIIYQLLNQKDPLNSSHILVAPTKEEQHTYFLNKRLDYLDKFKPIVDEMELEVQNSFAQSPACISGIGFKNFRKFVNLPVLPLAGVNILVGGNNAGKSSLVKGLILTLDNIKKYVVDNNDNSTLNALFQFDANNYHDVHIGTFDRSYSYDAVELDPASKERTMTFILRCAHFEINIEVKPQYKNDTTNVPIKKIVVADHKRDATFSFDYEIMTTSAKFTIGEDKIDFEQTGFVIPIQSYNYGQSQISMLIRGIVTSKDAIPTLLSDKDQLEKIRSKAGFILEIADELERVIRNTSIEYICAHGVNQKVLFNYNDKNDYMAQTLHDLVMEKIGDIEEEFICYWLDEFGLGVDFDVHSIGGEAYILQIKNYSGKMVYLADLGMGSNQFVILILRLAIIIHRHRMLGKIPYRPTIIIEEPEQNMHPAFQSKLATLFFDVYKKYGFSFIVETHSEYMVRRSQVIVAKEAYKDEEELKEKCPFKVYYLPSNDQPYEMLYRTDGNFSNEFGKGFYDEANNLLFEII